MIFTFHIYLACIYMASHLVTCTWHFNWNMATPNHTTESACMLMGFIWTEIPWGKFCNCGFFGSLNREKLIEQHYFGNRAIIFTGRGPSTLFSKRSAHWFTPVLPVTLGHWPWPRVMLILSKGLDGNMQKTPFKNSLRFSHNFNHFKFDTGYLQNKNDPRLGSVT